MWKILVILFLFILCVTQCQIEQDKQMESCGTTSLQADPD